MNNRIDINLDEIPNPKECHEVPVGAVIPAGTPLWTVHAGGGIEWIPDGYLRDVFVRDGDLPRLTVDQHAASERPSASDSPIIVTKYCKGLAGNVCCDIIALHEPDDNTWVIVNQDGGVDWLCDFEILEWSPAIIAKTEIGIWDDRDKRDRRTKIGYKLAWSEERQMWVLKTDWRCYYGTLDAVRCLNGDAFLTGFADDKGGEE